MLGGARTGLLNAFSNEGYLTRGEAENILNLVDEIKTDLPIVELGVFAGNTTALIGEYLQMNNRPNKVIGIDICNFVPYGDLLRRVEHLPNVQMIQGLTGDKNIRNSIGDISMLFIDGDHSEKGAGEDMDNWIPKVKEIVAIHDYYSPYSEHDGIKVAAEKRGLKVERGTDTLGILRVKSKS